MARKAAKIIKSIFVAIVLGVLILLFHYLYYESTRLEACGVNVFKDWKSYIAYILSKIPYIKDRIEYVPLKIADPKEYYRAALSGVIADIDEKISKLQEKEQKIKEMEEKYTRLLNALRGYEDRWKSEMDEVTAMKKEYEELDKRISDLRRILSSGDPEELSTILNQPQITAQTIAAALKGLPDALKADILQSLAKVNPSKAAEVTSLIGSIEEKEREIKEELERLRKELEQILNERKRLLKMENFVDVIKSYISSLEGADIVKLMMDLRVDVDTIAAVIANVPPEKARVILSILQKEHPEIFRELLERGVGR